MKNIAVSILATILSGLILSVYGAIQEIGTIKDRTQKNREDIKEFKRDIRGDLRHIRTRVDQIVHGLK